MKIAPQILQKSKIKQFALVLSLGILAMMLTGCWTPPNANVQPPGETRLIQSGFSADANNIRATVQSIDSAKRVLNLNLADGTKITCTVSPAVANFEQVQLGDRIRVNLTMKLAAYVLKDGRLLGAGGTEEVIPYIARVQSVDPSYRLLKVQFQNGQTLQLKTGLDAKLLEVRPGVSVVFQSADATRIRIEKK